MCGGSGGHPTRWARSRRSTTGSGWRDGRAARTSPQPVRRGRGTGRGRQPRPLHGARPGQDFLAGRGHLADRCPGARAVPVNGQQVVAAHRDRDHGRQCVDQRELALEYVGVAVAAQQARRAETAASTAVTMAARHPADVPPGLRRGPTRRSRPLYVCKRRLPSAASHGQPGTPSAQPP